MTVKTNRTFKFENWCLFEDDCHSTARNNWMATNDKPYHVRIAMLEGTLEKWSRSKRPLKQQLDTINQDMEMIQSASTHLQDQNLEGSLMEQYDKTMTKTNIILQVKG